MQQDTFIAEDDTQIVFRYWHATQPLNRVIILLHRGHEHSGRMQELAEFFCRQGYHVYAWDARGNGLSGGERDAASSFNVFARDLDQFVNLVSQQSGVAIHNMFVVASSMGAVIAASWLHDHAPKIRGVILATAAFEIQLYVPFATPLLKLARCFGWMPRVSSYVKSKVLTHDRMQQKLYNHDPLISGGISTDLLLDTLYTGQRLIANAGAIDTPMLMLCAGKDWVVKRSSQRKFFQRLTSNWKEWRYYPDCYHALFHEDSRQIVFRDCLDFIDRVFSAKPQNTDYQQAHQRGYSRDTYDALRLPSLNPVFPLTKWAMATLGQHSDGIKLAHQCGFDSGRSLDYVYENQPRGRNALGRIIDSIYLNSPGWAGIRRRKDLIDLLLEQQLERIKDNGNILDIAAGNGRYLLPPLTRYPNVQAELRDYDASNVKLIRQSGEALQLQHLDVVQADAFSPQSYALENKFDVAIISGLFELFGDNPTIQVALDGVAKQLKPGGILIYTNQAWHPQQEFIARTLTNHQGEPWVMRCRSQAEMDQLVSLSGLKKIQTQIEDAGIFSVSVAVKP